MAAVDAMARAPDQSARFRNGVASGARQAVIETTILSTPGELSRHELSLGGSALIGGVKRTRAVVVGDDHPAPPRALGRGGDAALPPPPLARGGLPRRGEDAGDGLARAVRRGLDNMRIQSFPTAAAINLKRLAIALMALMWALFDLRERSAPAH